MVSLSNKWLLTVLPILVGSFTILGIIAYQDTQYFREEFGVFNSELSEQTVEIRNARERVAKTLYDAIRDADDQWLERSAMAMGAMIYSIEQTAEICAKNSLVKRFIEADEALRNYSRPELDDYFDDLIDAYGLSEILLLDAQGKEISRRAAFVVPDGGDPFLDGYELPNVTTDESESPWFQALLDDDDENPFMYLYRDPNTEDQRYVFSVGLPLVYDDDLNLETGPVGYLQFVKPLEYILRFISTESSLGSELLVEDVRRKKYILPDENYGDFVGDKILSREYVFDGVINLCRYAPGSVIDSALQPIKDLSAGIDGLSEAHNQFAADFESSTEANQWYFAGIITVLLGVTAFLIVRLSGRLSKELRNVEEAAKRVSEGDLSADFVAQSSVREFYALGESVEQMRKRLANQIEALDAEVARQTEALLNKNSVLAYEVETRRAAEELAYQASRAKSEFLATMSHEIRTPLNGVVAMIHKFKDSEVSEEQEEWLRILSVSSEALLTLINDILDFSKIESGQMSLEEIPYSVVDLKDSIAQMFESRFAEKGICLQTHIDAGVSDGVRGDPNRMRQILINLIGNALKFTEEGYVRMDISMDQKDQDYLCVSVEDSGIGIPAAVQGKLFNKFVQADSSTTRKHGGSGLGLAITERLIALMGGTIFFASEEGKGSQFFIRIPVKLASEADVRSLEKARKPAGSDSVAFEKASILVVDDSQMNLKVVEILLKKLPVDITTANSGEEALEKIEGSTFDLVLMDCQMPGMDGYQTTEKIRNLSHENPNTKIPVIALTGNVTAEGKQLCRAAGMNGFLSKPVNMAHLVRELNAHLAPKAEPEGAAT